MTSPGHFGLSLLCVVFMVAAGCARTGPPSVTALSGLETGKTADETTNPGEAKLAELLHRDMTLPEACEALQVTHVVDDGRIAETTLLSHTYKFRARKFPRRVVVLKCSLHNSGMLVEGWSVREMDWFSDMVYSKRMSKDWAIAEDKKWRDLLRQFEELDVNASGDEQTDPKEATDP